MERLTVRCGNGVEHWLDEFDSQLTLAELEEILRFHKEDNDCSARETLSAPRYMTEGWGRRSW